MSLHSDGKWQASIGINGKSKYLGLFKTEEDAALKYNQFIIDNNIEFGNLNTIIQ